MTESLREKLDLIDEWFRGADGNDLASVLSAIRGPDDPKDSFINKNGRTNVIRRVAFPRTFVEAKSSMTYSATPFSMWDVIDTKSDYLPVTKDEVIHNHYKQHVYAAARILGLQEDLFPYDK